MLNLVDTKIRQALNTIIAPAFIEVKVMQASSLYASKISSIIYKIFH